MRPFSITTEPFIDCPSLTIVALCISVLFILISFVTGMDKQSSLPIEYNKVRESIPEISIALLDIYKTNYSILNE